ncbi:GNAT family N-acetyltransferase [Halobacillus campisalis]|uniref:GNAT family N-acetyltransferase n=1 Tax=Halobacillus campisalis TaxID=435909 RepID=A0ABW2JZH9_9BACI|nr:GNAT family N-acetyltransferase [Halobacillus campisalis]
MKLLTEKEGLSFYLYKPTILKPFFKQLEPITLKRRIRLLLAYFTGYTVYYIGENNNLIGYCLVQNGKDNRYKFASEKDVIVGPYFIHEEYRGRKLSKILLEFILKQPELTFRYAYDYIHKDNIPSIKATEAVGFHYLSHAHISKFLRTIKLCEKGEGDYVVYKYIKK